MGCETKKATCILAVIICMVLSTPVFSQPNQTDIKISFRVKTSDGRLAEIEKACKIIITEIFWVSRPGRGPLYRALLIEGQTIQGAKDCLSPLSEIESVYR